MKFASLEGMTIHRCPFCGLRIIGNRATSSFAHEEPQCARFGPALRKRFPSFKEMAVEPTVRIAPPTGKTS
jgi:hypothetical protein